MALWLVRGGRHGENEDRFFETGQVCLTWGKIEDQTLEGIPTQKAMRAFVTKTYPGKSPAWVSTNAAQFWTFLARMQVGDLVVTPRKGKPAIAIGTITGPYKFDPTAPRAFRHIRPIKWLVLDAPRSSFEQDLLYSFGAFITICQIKRNDAEERVRQKLKEGFKGLSAGQMVQDQGELEGIEVAEPPVEIARLARDQIAQLLERQFKGHAMARLVASILDAEGYLTRVSPEGTDKGIDILAAPGSLGFGHPRICVQVKSGSSPVDRPTLDQLLGAMSNVDADQGLLVSWGGFKSSVEREASTQYFRVRLWDSDALVENLLAHYDKLSDEIRAEIPLQRVWTLVVSEDET